MEQECLEFCGSLYSRRSVHEIILKTLSIRVAVALAAGHLGTLRRQPRQVQTFYTLGFLILPALPVVMLLVKIYQVTFCRLTRRNSTPYLISAVLGSYCVANEDPTGTEDLAWYILDTQENRIERETGNYDSRWFGRVFALLVFLAQAIAALVVSLGRTSRGSEYCGIFDMLNMLYLFSGIVVAGQCLLIHACNWTWRWKRDSEPSTAQWQTYLNSIEPLPNQDFYDRTRPLVRSTSVELDMSIFLTTLCFMVGRVTTLFLVNNNPKITVLLYSSSPHYPLVSWFNLIVWVSLGEVSSMMCIVDLIVISSDMNLGHPFNRCFRVWGILGLNRERVTKILSVIRAVAVPSLFIFSWYVFILEVLDITFCFDDEKQRCKWLSWKDPMSDSLWQF